MVLQRSVNTGAERHYLAIVGRQIGCIVEMQLRLALRFRPPLSTAISLNSFVAVCQSRQRIGSAERAIDWTLEGADCWFDADAQAVSVMLVEIADHWFALVGGSIKASACGGNVCFKMQRTMNANPEEGLPGLAAGITDELNAVVTRYGGKLICGAEGRELEVNFPANPSGGQQL